MDIPFISGSSTNPGRFALIEILVVTTVIAILAAVLLPALARANNRAIRALCLSNVGDHAVYYFYPFRGLTGAQGNILWHDRKGPRINVASVDGHAGLVKMSNANFDPKGE